MPFAKQKDVVQAIPRDRVNKRAGLRFWQIVLQNDFWSRGEEHYLRIRPLQRKLIHKSAPSDSIIAHFPRSGG